MTVRILVGHVIDRLRDLQDESVHCVVSSPPYYGLRDYNIEPQVWGGDWRGSLGLEPTPALYIEHMVAVFREVRRVLRKDGTLWLNIGDSYASRWATRRNEGRAGMEERGRERTKWTDASLAREGLKDKDLIGIPWALAFALRDDGWYLRSEITWAKRAPMPESVTDRPTCATEKVFLLTKSGDSTYWTHRDHEGTRVKPAPDYRWIDTNDDFEYNTEPPPGWKDEIRLKNWPGANPEVKRWKRINLWDAHDYFYDAFAVQEDSETDPKENYPARAKITGRGQQGFADARGNDRDKSGGFPPGSSGKRNMRNFLLLGPAPFAEAHFATFVPRIPEIAISAGTSERGVCPKCGAPWERLTKTSTEWSRPKRAARVDSVNDGKGHVSDQVRDGHDIRNGALSNTTTIGWRPTCACDAGQLVPATVLDPFLGAGTTTLVADRLGRDAIGIELSPSYAEMAERRLRDDAGLFAQVVD